MKTSMARNETVQRDWVQVDATGRILGRLATEIAMKLMGKDKPVYTPHVDTGDYIVVTNVEKIAVTGKKAEMKEYRFHSGYVGGLKTISYKRMMAKEPDKILRLAVRRMLPKTKLGKQMLTKLKLYAGDKHEHEAQQPQAWEPKK